MCAIERFRFSLCLLPAAVALAVSAVHAEAGAQDQNQPVTVSASREQSDWELKITYTFTLNGAEDDEVTLTLPSHGVARPFGNAKLDGCTSTTSGAATVEGDRLTWKCTLEGTTGTIALTVVGDRYKSRFGSSIASVAVGSRRASSEVDSLVSSGDEGWFQPIFGGGVAFLRDDFAEFTGDEEVLLVSNDSRFRSTAIVGGLFRIAEIGARRRQISALVSLQFTQGTANALDGVAFGLAAEISPILHLTGGFSIGKGQELSPGFRRAARHVIDAQLEAGNAAYQRFADWDPDKKDEKPLDGLSLLDPATGERFFPGDPIVDSYNSAFFIGVVMPVRLSALFSTSGS